MIPRVLHPMTPLYLPSLKQKFSPNLLDIAPVERILPAGNRLHDRLQSHSQHRLRQVIRLLRPHRQVGCHAEDVVEFARRICVDGVDARGHLDVLGNEGCLAAADDLDGGGRGEARARDGVAKGADVFLADLRVVSAVSKGEESREIYAAEEMPDEDDEHSLCSVRVGVEILEWAGGAVAGQDEDIASVAQVCCGGLVIGNRERKVTGGVHMIVRG